MSAQRMQPRTSDRSGFTLVEIMVVLIIIGILAGLLVPAVNFAIKRATDGAMKMEVNSLAQAVEQYQLKYGDYPPDGSDWQVMQRHMRKAFPRMAEPDNTLLQQLTHIGVFPSAVKMDRAEALVFFLGGFSSDPAHPLTGPGGPLEFVGRPNNDKTKIDNYQYNATRENAFFDFAPNRLTLAFNEQQQKYVSSDEQQFGVADAAHGRDDLLPTYLVDGGETPIVYFDSRTYGAVGATYNGYALPNYGGVRPYKTRMNAQPPQGGSYGSESAAFEAIPFVNPDSFQIISPGRDNLYGQLTFNPDDGNLPVHFVVETGKAFSPIGSASSVDGMQVRTIEGFQEVGVVSNISENGQLDNVTNFSGTTLEGDLAD